MSSSSLVSCHPANHFIFASFCCCCHRCNTSRNSSCSTYMRIIDDLISNEFVFWHCSAAAAIAGLAKRLDGSTDGDILHNIVFSGECDSDSRFPFFFFWRKTEKRKRKWKYSTEQYRLYNIRCEWLLNWTPQSRYRHATRFSICSLLPANYELWEWLRHTQRFPIAIATHQMCGCVRES